MHWMMCSRMLARGYAALHHSAAAAAAPPPPPPPVSAAEHKLYHADPRVLATRPLL